MQNIKNDIIEINIRNIKTYILNYMIHNLGNCYISGYEYIADNTFYYTLRINKKQLNNAYIKIKNLTDIYKYINISVMKITEYDDECGNNHSQYIYLKYRLEINLNHIDEILAIVKLYN